MTFGKLVQENIPLTVSYRRRVGSQYSMSPRKANFEVGFQCQEGSIFPCLLQLLNIGTLIM